MPPARLTGAPAWSQTNPDSEFLGQVRASGTFMASGVGEIRRAAMLYTWDVLHGEIEIFNLRGRHLGVADPMTGDLIKPARKGRRIRA